MKEHRGDFPDTVDQVAALPGIGRSTAGAILAQSRGMRAPILDGNVKRVLARLHAVPGWPGRKSVENRLWELAELHTPNERLADYTQAVMDLGAMLCTGGRARRPACSRCPVTHLCQAHANGNPQDYPGRKPAKNKPVRAARMLILQNRDGRVWLEPRPPSGIWGGLWCFPELDSTARDTDGDQSDALARRGFSARDQESLPGFRHTFSHFHLDVEPRLIRVDSHGHAVHDAEGRWIDPAAPGELGLAAPVKKLLDQLDGPRQQGLL